jgi:glycosyltransferase involved in cell wall biosynthesis
LNEYIRSKENASTGKCYDVAIAYHWDNGTSKICLEDIRARCKLQWVQGDVGNEAQLKELELPLLAQNHSHFDKIVLIDESIKKSYEQLLPFMAEKCEVLLNCIENYEIISKAVVPERIEEYKNKENIIVTVARLEPQKAITRAIEAARIMHENLYSFQWFFLGDGSERKQIQELIDKYGLNGCCHLLGTKANPWKYVFQADIFALLSLWEGRGMAVDEAKILEKPILISNFGPAASIIEHQVNGLICENTLEGIVEGLELLLENNKLRQELSANLRGYLFDNKKTVEGFNELVNTLLP